jgi:hypothetical protein
MTLGEECRHHLSSGPDVSICPQRLSNVFGYRRHGPSPNRRRLCEVLRQRTHETAVACARLEEGFPLERLASQPLQHIGVDQWTHRFHQVTREVVSRDGVCMQNAKPRIQAYCSSRQTRLGLQNRIQVVEDPSPKCLQNSGGIGGIREDARELQRRNKRLGLKHLVP